MSTVDSYLRTSTLLRLPTFMDTSVLQEGWGSGVRSM
jgi:hypothetical protein